MSQFDKFRAVVVKHFHEMGLEYDVQRDTKWSDLKFDPLDACELAMDVEDAFDIEIREDFFNTATVGETYSLIAKAVQIKQAA
jgi:acyl carrier protein